MPQQHRFEGSELGTLLERVQEELGPECRIVEANRLRRGGVGGFFARETYEVIAETLSRPESPFAAASSTGVTASASNKSGASTELDGATATVSSNALSILELADLMNERERVLGPEPSRSEVEDLRREPIAPLAAKAPVSPTVDPPVSRTVEPPAPPAATPYLSTETTSFAEILDRLAADIDARSEIVVPAGPKAVPVNPTLPQATPAEDVEAVKAPDLGPANHDPAPTTVPSEVLPHVAATAAPPERSTPTTDLAVAVSAPGATQPTEQQPHVPIRLTNSGAPSRQLTFASPLARRVVDERDKDLEPFLRIGLPSHLAPLRVGDFDLRNALIDRLRHLPTPPPFPTARGSLMAVVGSAQSALRVARELAHELGIVEEDIALASAFSTNEVASWLHVTTPQDAMDRRRSWRRRDDLTIVAVDSPVGRFGSSWAREVLDALEPSLVWGIVEASRKPEDVLAWTEHLGGLDSFAVEQLDSTTTPAAILKLPIPVARLDGVPATPEQWASILAARLAA